jgi:centrosomal protein CEP76
MKPVSRLLKGSIGIIHLELDFEPTFAKSDLLSALLVKNQQDTEAKLEAEGNKKFLEYAKDWDMEYRAIRKSHKERLVKIYVETDDRNAPYRAS